MPEDYNLDPLDPHAYAKARAEHLMKKLGSNSETDPEFAPLDDSASRARIASQKLKDAIAAAGADETRPMRFSIRVANRSVPIELKEEDGVWSCNMPVRTSDPFEPIAVYEWRRIEVHPPEGYDELLATINRLANAGPTIHDLTPEQELELARACATKNKATLAAVLEAYLRLRLGPGADESSLNDPRYRSTVDEACLFVFAHSEPSFPNTPAAVAFIRKYAAGRPLTIPLCKAAMKVYEEKAEEQAEQLAAVPQVTEEDLASMSDRDIEKTLTGVRREHADTERRRRDLLRYDSRQEYRRAEDVIKELHNIEE